MRRFTLPFFAAALLSSPLFAIELPTTSPSEGSSLNELRATAKLEEIRQQRNAYEASCLVARAAREEGAGRDEQAEPLYARALELDPKNENAARGLQATRERLGLVTNGRPLIERAEKEQNTRRQETLYRFENAMTLAEKARKTGEPKGFETARLQLDRARIIRAQNPSLFSDEEAARLDARLRDEDVAIRKTAQAREDAIKAAELRDLQRRIKEARIHDISLD
jgi:hypothetical protein